MLETAIEMRVSASILISYTCDVDMEKKKLTNSPSHRYKIGDAFFHVQLPQAQEMLLSSTSQVEEDVSVLEDKLGTVKDEMTQLKVELYARFGRSINLET